MKGDLDSSLLDDSEESEVDLDEDEMDAPNENMDVRRRVERHQELLRLRRLLDDSEYEFEDD